MRIQLIINSQGKAKIKRRRFEVLDRAIRKARQEIALNEKQINN